MSDIIEVLTPDMVGKRVTCTIKGIDITDAKLQMFEGKYYICQDSIKGGSIHTYRFMNYLGYRYVWRYDYCVTDLRLVEEKEEIPDLQTSVNKTIQKAQTPNVKIQRLAEVDKYLQPVENNILKDTHSKNNYDMFGVSNNDILTRINKHTKEEIETTDLVETYTTPQYIELNPKKQEYEYYYYKGELCAKPKE